MSVLKASTSPSRYCAHAFARAVAGTPQAFRHNTAPQSNTRHTPLTTRTFCPEISLQQRQTCLHGQLSMRHTHCFCSSSQPGSSSDKWDIKMLYDGDCPLCMREVNMLRKRDKDKNRINFVDIASQDYNPADNADISYKQAMGSIHGVLPGGKVITNVDVFRKLYEAVGLGWVYSITKFGPINKVANWVYAIWAKYRLPLTGRPDIEAVLRDKQAKCKPASSQQS